MSALLQRLTTPARLATRSNFKWFSVYSPLCNTGNPLEQVEDTARKSEWHAFSSLVNSSEKKITYEHEDLPPAEHWAKRSERLIATLPPPQSMLTGKFLGLEPYGIINAFTWQAGRFHA
jgi:hypothetical protein